jgi:hypothetical protein
MGHKSQEPIKRTEPKKPLIMLGAYCKKAHVRPKISMRPNNKKIDVFHLSLAPLFKKSKANDIRGWVHVVNKKQEEKAVKAKAKQVLSHKGIPEPSKFWRR